MTFLFFIYYDCSCGTLLGNGTILGGDVCLTGFLPTVPLTALAPYAAL